MSTTGVKRIIFQPTEAVSNKLRESAEKNGVSISTIINSVFNEIDEVKIVVGCEIKTK